MGQITDTNSFMVGVWVGLRLPRIYKDRTSPVIEGEYMITEDEDRMITESGNPMVTE